MPLTREQRQAARATAKRIFDSLGPETRSSILDEMVWNSFDPLDFFDEPLPPGVSSHLGDLIERWEQTS